MCKYIAHLYYTWLRTTNYYSESQIYEYIARVFYNVVFIFGSNAAEKLIYRIHISGLLIYLE